MIPGPERHPNLFFIGTGPEATLFRPAASARDIAGVLLGMLGPRAPRTPCVVHGRR
ncbi:hypothetical protein [Streptomyces sp. WAC04114]|uniref:hypothetical protein n=1 Tax=Streptomyces sp. WAC04114 TaxID=2867961 RepID=UPI001C8C1032|nr:hypothetical protein [Streptomyces sp. WAC04114]MBX9361021.1 hypothetical protein [Streptomyces sp. WAC04114]